MIDASSSFFFFSLSHHPKTKQIFENKQKLFWGKNTFVSQIPFVDLSSSKKLVLFCCAAK
jgi:hypothetical protein